MAAGGKGLELADLEEDGGGGDDIGCVSPLASFPVPCVFAMELTLSTIR